MNPYRRDRHVTAIVTETLIRSSERVPREQLRTQINAMATAGGWSKKAGRGSPGSHVLGKVLNDLRRRGLIESDDQHIWRGPKWITDTDRITCHRKIRYRTFEGALEHMEWLLSKRDLGWEPSAAYACKVCEGWHLTSRNQERFTGRAGAA